MPVTAALLEDRINQYINAVDSASAVHDAHRVSQLQRDIQQLVDLMERVNSGYTVPESVIPPPLVIAPQIGILPNPMNELSARLANYHKALYFAEEELSDKRMQKIQRLQQCLQIINDLQKNVEAGFPVRVDEIPPPVPIPSDDEFDNNAVETITQRIASYKAALLAAEQSKTARDRKHVPKLQSALRTLEFLMTRAKANRPVWKQDIPPEYEYHDSTPERSASKMNKTRFILMLRAQLLKAGKIRFTSHELQQKVTELYQKLSDMEKQMSAQNSDFQENEAVLTVLTQQVQELEKLSVAEQNGSRQWLNDCKSLVELRLKEYTASALEYKKNNQVDEVLKQFKILKRLRTLKESLDKDEMIDISLIPPPVTELPFSAESKIHTEQSSSAAADLSPVIIKPAIETQEDKLAKKLSQYLEKGGEEVLYGQTSSETNVNLNQAQATGLLPKVPNTLRNVTTQSSSVSHIKMANSTNNLGSSTEPNFEQPQPLGERQSVTEDFPSLDKQDAQQDPEVNNSLSHSAISQSGSPRSSDIYTRKTLDSVGFLPCQNVPDPQKVKQIPMAVVNTSGEQSLNCVPQMQSNFEDSQNTMSPFGLPELNFQHPDSKSNGPSSLNLSVAHSEDFISSKFSSLPVVLSQSSETVTVLNSPMPGQSNKIVTSNDKQFTSPILLQHRNQTSQLAHSTVINSLHAESINSKAQTFYSTSNESSEFQDLMDSMMMPTMISNAPVKSSEAGLTHGEVNTAVGSEWSSSQSFTNTRTTLSHKGSSLSAVTQEDCRSQPSPKDSLPNNNNEQSYTSQTYNPIMTTAGKPSALLNFNIPMDNTNRKPVLPESHTLTGSQPDCVQDNPYHTNEYDSLTSSVEFTCLENLKYDFLIKEAKDSAECKEEAQSLRHRFEEIKQILKEGNIEIWEEYKSCVESELASFIKQIETLRVHQRWTEMRILSEKKQIAERELAILRERLPELKI